MFKLSRIFSPEQTVIDGTVAKSHKIQRAFKETTTNFVKSRILDNVLSNK